MQKKVQVIKVKKTLTNAAEWKKSNGNAMASLEVTLEPEAKGKSARLHCVANSDALLMDFHALIV